MKTRINLLTNVKNDGQATVERRSTDGQSQRHYTLGLMKYAAMITLLLTLACGQMWGTETLQTIDFTSWTTETVSAGGTSHGFYFVSQMTITNGTGLGLTSNMSTSSNYVAIPLSGIHGQVTVTVTHPSGRPEYSYGFTGLTSEATSSNLSTAPSAKIDAPRIAENGTSTTWSFVASKPYGVFYFGRKGSSATVAATITITTINEVDWSTSTFYTTYASSNKNAATLISDASLPANIIISGISAVQNGNGCSSSVSTPHNFSSLASGTTYYRLKTGNTNTITFAALSNVKSIRLYGAGNGGSRTVTVTVDKVSGTGSSFSVTSMSMSTPITTVSEYSTGDLTGKSGYDADTYYNYTITFPGAADIWGIYVEAAAAVSGYTVTYANGGATSGSVPVDASSPYAADDVVTILGNTGSLAKTGYTFAGWSANVNLTIDEETVTAGTTIEAGKTFPMPESNVTLTAVWTALQDKFQDKEHGNSQQTRSGVPVLPTPTLSDFTPVNSYCNDLHYKFIGWVISTSVNDDGTLKSGAEIVPGGQSGWVCTGATYYAVWAAENE